MEKLEMGDVVYYIEWDTIQWQSIISNKLRKKIEESWMLWTKDLKLAEKALRDNLWKQLDAHVKDQLGKFIRNK